MIEMRLTACRACLTAVVLLALPLLGHACDWPWAKEGRFDPGRCDPRCVSGEFCYEAKCLKKCANGFEPYGPACMPVLNNCKDNEVPVPGGGCKRVGAEEQSCGISASPSWKCTAIGLPTTCITDWTLTHKGWCEPSLPIDNCTATTLEVIGKTTCQPVGICWTGTWGGIKIPGKAIVYVNKSYALGDSDGTITKPYTSIRMALSLKGPATAIVVAAGEYIEDLTIKGPVTSLADVPRW